MPTINLTDDELAALTAAIRSVIDEDRFPPAPRLDALHSALAKLDPATAPKLKPQDSRMADYFESQGQHVGPPEGHPMNRALPLIAGRLGVLFLAVAATYWFVPAGHLPSFFPGFKEGSDHIARHHAIGSLIIALVLFTFACIQIRRNAPTGGARSMVDHGLATPASFPWCGADARHRRDNDSRRRAWAR